MNGGPNGLWAHETARTPKPFGCGPFCVTYMSQSASYAG